MTILTPLIMLISIVTAGGGHGTQIPTLLCYPIFFIFDVFDSGGGPLVWIMLIGQFPLYGLVIDLGERVSRGLLVTVLIISFHAILILIQQTTLDFGNIEDRLLCTTKAISHGATVDI